MQDVSVRSLLGAPPAKQCQRFIKGICILNKKGKKCSSSHDIPDPDLREISPNGKPVCKVKCELKPHATIKGACINGKDCLYKHADTTANQKKCAQRRLSHLSLWRWEILGGGNCKLSHMG
jgi:hypothetical protein